VTPQELKASILQLAIQGKLVEQRPEEGTGAELLEKILAAKGEKGTKKNSRAETPRRRGKADTAVCSSPGCPVSPSSPVPPADAPFDIPESWVWVRLASVTDMLAGFAFKSTDFKTKEKENIGCYVASILELMMFGGQIQYTLMP